MNDRQISSFLRIAETGSFSRAAQESYISVPAMIQQIDRLEETLEFPLFVRTNQGVTLTWEGQIFYEAARKMRATYEEALEKARAGKSKKLNIGVAPGQCPEILLDACTRFRKAYPAVEIHFAELPYGEHLEALRDGRIDLTVIACPEEAALKGLLYEELCQDVYAFGMNAGHPLAKKALLHMKDLQNACIRCGTYSYMKYPFEQMLEESGANLKIIDSEYDLESRAQARFEDELLVFHSLWRNNYEHMFRIVPSDIRAGNIGIVTRNHPETPVKQLIEQLRAEQHE